MKKLFRTAIVATLVTAGCAALAVKKLTANPELKEKVKEDGKKLAEDTKEFSKSVGVAAKDVTAKVKNEAVVVADKIKTEAAKIKAEADAKIKEKQCESVIDEETVEEEVIDETCKECESTEEVAEETVEESTEPEVAEETAEESTEPEVAEENNDLFSVTDYDKEVADNDDYDIKDVEADYLDEGTEDNEEALKKLDEMMQSRIDSEE